MKKTLSKEARIKEAAFWTKLHQAAKENPGKVCHKWKSWKSWSCRSATRH